MDNPLRVRPQVYALYMVGSAGSIIYYTLLENYHALVWCCLFWVMCWVFASLLRDFSIMKIKVGLFIKDVESLEAPLQTILQEIDKARQNSHLDK